MTEPPKKPDDELLERYADAVAQDPRRPSDRVRQAARAHAQMLHDQAAELTRADDTPPTKTAANQPQWTLSLAASLAVVGLAGLLYVQIDRGAPDVREAALGTTARNEAPAAASTASPVPPSAAPSDTAAARAPAKPAAVAMATKPAAPDKSVAPPAPVAAKPPVQVTPQGMADVAVARSNAPAAPAAPAEADAAATADTAVRASRYEARPEARLDARLDARAVASAESTARAAAPAAPTAPAAKAAPSPVPAAAAVAAAAAPPAAAPVAAAPPPAGLANRARDAGAGPATAQFLQAARSGDMRLLQELLAQGVAINSRDDNGNTALMLAVRQRHAATVRKLLEWGADTALVNKDGLTALRLADQMGFADIAQLLQAAPTR